VMNLSLGTQFGMKTSTLADHTASLRCRWHWELSMPRRLGFASVVILVRAAGLYALVTSPLAHDTCREKSSAALRKDPLGIPRQTDMERLESLTGNDLTTGNFFDMMQSW